MSVPDAIGTQRGHGEFLFSFVDVSDGWDADVMRCG